jgi:CspA family cold shock protein
VRAYLFLLACADHAEETNYAGDMEDAGMMLTGKVVRFDEVRGYGFIAPDGGGEDVFVHANVLGDDKYVFGPGIRVEFEATDGDRGPKAYAVNLLPDSGPAPAAALAMPPVIPPGIQVRVAPPEPAPPPVTAPPVTAPPPNTAPPVTTPAAEHAAAAPAASPDSADEELCDVLTALAYSQEITELLLKSAPTATAAQILDMRAALISFARQHGWIEG